MTPTARDSMAFARMFGGMACVLFVIGIVVYAVTTNGILEFIGILAMFASLIPAMLAGVIWYLGYRYEREAMVVRGNREVSDGD